jgi:hypothetical protein
MITPGMPVVSRDGHRLGYVTQVIAGDAQGPPGVVVTIPRLFGLRRSRVALTTFDVRDVRAGSVLLRITRWDAHNRAGHARAGKHRPPATRALHRPVDPQLGGRRADDRDHS